MSRVHDGSGAATNGICVPGATNGHISEIHSKPLPRVIDSVSDTSLSFDDASNSRVPLPSLIVIDHRTLIRECLVRALRTVVRARVGSYDAIDSWLEVADNNLPAAILLGISGSPGDTEIMHHTASALSKFAPVPLIVIGESEDPEQIIEALESGARGYIPTNLPLAIAVHALRLVTEGGVFVPANSLIAAHGHPTGKPRSAAPELQMFTARQAAVVRALCRGKANKMIAYELNMCESTVKVHVRNIMKKLKAKNRTEVAVMFKSLSNSEPDNTALQLQV